MSFDVEKFKKAIDEDLKDPNGYWNTLAKKEDLAQKRYDKFDEIIKDMDFDKLMNRLKEEHNEEYRDKCYKKGYEPYSNRKLSFLYSYISDRLEPINTPEWIGNDFPTTTYFFKGYYFCTTFGQGSFDHIYTTDKKRFFTV